MLAGKMRWWSSIHAECPRRKKIFKYIAILIVAQAFILLSSFMTAHIYRNIYTSSTVKRDTLKLISIEGSSAHRAINETKKSATEGKGSLEGKVSGTKNDHQDEKHSNVYYTVIFDSEREVQRSKNSEANNIDSKSIFDYDNVHSLLNKTRNSGQNKSKDNQIIQQPLKITDTIDLKWKAENKTVQVNNLHSVQTSEGVENKSTASREKIKNTEAKFNLKDNSTVLEKLLISDNIPRSKQPNTSETHRSNNTLHHEDGYSPVITKNYKFKSYRVEFPQKYVLKSDDNSYFIKIDDNRTCFKRGTDIDKTKQTSGEKCLCHENYYGTDCGIPEAVWFSLNSIVDSGEKLQRRSIPRRILNGLPVNHEFAMFEARMHELYDVVDVFLIAESNYTAHGDPKELQFLKQFRKGYLANFQDKMVYVKLGFFSDAAKADGWFADSYIRTYMGKEGLRQITGLRDDDIFVLSDADELPTKEVLTFLKLYDGYPEPVAFGLRWNIFNFYWLMPTEQNNVFRNVGENERLTVVYSAATIGFLRDLAQNDAFLIRKVGAWQQTDPADRLKEYRKDHFVKQWVVGTVRHYAGWHCSWCFSPKNIVRKLESAQASDKPRWGDYPQKKNIDYITSLIWKGRWFDDKQHFEAVENTQERFYAPPYLLKHPERYRSILFHPSHPLNRNKEWRPH